MTRRMVAATITHFRYGLSKKPFLAWGFFLFFGSGMGAMATVFCDEIACSHQTRDSPIRTLTFSVNGCQVFGGNNFLPSNVPLALPMSDISMLPSALRRICRW